jgi:hypothetical protein
MVLIFGGFMGDFACANRAVRSSYVLNGDADSEQQLEDIGRTYV